MKRFLASLAVLAVAALGLTGCTAGTSIVAGSQLSIAAVGELKSLNPDLAISQESDALAHELSQLTTVGFYYTNSDGQLLANEKLGTVEVESESPLKVTYAIVATAKWSDGVAVDASDLVLSWLAASDPTEAGFGSERGITGLNAATKAPSVAEDGKSITVSFDSSVSDYRTALTIPVAAHIVAQAAFDSEQLTAEAAKKRVLDAVASADEVELKALAKAYRKSFKFGSTLSAAKRVTAGAYTIESASAEAITLKANSAFTWGPAPKVETVNLKFFADSNAVLAALQSGEVDIASPAEQGALKTSDILVQLAAMKANGVKTKVAASTDTEQILLNYAPGSFFSAQAHKGNAKKAEKLALAFMQVIPRAKIIAAAASDVNVVESKSFVYPASDSNYKAVIDQNGSNAFRMSEVEKAREAVDKIAEVTGRYKVHVLFDSDSLRAQVEFSLIAEKSSAARFQMDNISTSDITDILPTNDWDVLITESPLIGSAQGRDALSANLTRLLDPAPQAALTKALQSSDATKRAEALQELDAALFKANYGLPLYQIPSIVAYNERVGGFMPAPYGRSATYGYWFWSVEAPKNQG